MAARELTRSAIQEDLPTIERASRKETVLWTKTAIADILERLHASNSPPTENQVPTEPSSSEISEDYVRDLHAQAVRETTSLILHELQPLIGRLAKSLSDELPDFQSSRSRTSLDKLRTMMEIIAELRSASTAPTFQQFDLEELIQSVCKEESAAGSPVDIQFAGTRPFVIVSDPARIRLALANGLRNAVEATLANSADGAPEPVVITWSSRPEEVWIAILDSGPGLRVDPSRVFSIGTTTKRGHFGMGLPLAQQAISSIGGDLALTNRPPRGAKLELRWPKYRASQTALNASPRP
jgi:signal transduction histidine kinase